jgi:hypothetical protein
MKKLLTSFAVIFYFSTSFLYSQGSESALVINKHSFRLVPDEVIQVELASAIKGFLKARYNGGVSNPFVDSDYLKKNDEPFQWLIGAEGKLPNGEDFYTPTLLAVLPVAEQKYIVKLAFMGVSNEKADPLLNLIATLEIRKINGKYFFYNAIEYNTRNYNVSKVGNIKYIYPNKLDLKKSKQMDDFNTSFAKKFNTKPLEVTYYKCDDPEQLFKMLGYDFMSNMYFSLSGGLAEWWTNTLYAGNNSELYEHEVVHFYTSKLFEHKSRVVDEGYATYVGGSGGVDISKLAVNAKAYIHKNPNDKLDELATNFETRVAYGVPITYILSGLICKDIEEKLGVSAIKKLFSPEPQEDYFDTLKRVNGIGKEEFSAYLKSLLSKY